MGVFLIARDALREILLAMGLSGIGVGCVLAANTLQIIRGVRAAETDSAMSFYQVLRSIGFSAGSALSATVLAAHIPAGQVLPAASGYSASSWVSIAMLIAALALSVGFAFRTRATRVPRGT